MELFEQSEKIILFIKKALDKLLKIGKYIGES